MSDDRFSGLVRLAHVIAAVPAGEPLPVRLCRAYAEVVGADGGAITLSPTTSQRLTLSASNGVSDQIEDLQDVLGQGPGQDAYLSGHVVRTEVDGVRDRSFPIFSELASSVAGALTVWAIPMHPSGTTIGVISVYRREGNLAYSLDDAQFLADAVGAALLEDENAHGVTRFSRWTDQARVNQAAGMVVAQLGVAPGDALAILRAHAFALSTTLGAIAIEVIERRLGFMRTERGVTLSEEPPADPMAAGDPEVS